MKKKFDVEIAEYTEITELPHGWSADDYRKLLEQLEVSEVAGIPENELAEMAIIALQDMEDSEAAEHVLTNRMSDILAPGQIRNCAQDLRDEPLWEAYSDPKAHKNLFICAGLLALAFPNEFTMPVALEILATITAPADCSNLRGAVQEKFLLRLLADGMDDDAILTRFYEDQLAAGPFPEASAIIWDVDTLEADGRRAQVKLWTSRYWMRGLPDEGQFSATTDVQSEGV